MSDRTHTLYVGVTNHLAGRVFEHKQELLEGFTADYSLGLFQEATDVHEAIVREKQIKIWLRAKKLALIESANPRWQDPSSSRFEREKPLRSDPSLRPG